MEIKRTIPNVTKFEVNGVENIGTYYLQTRYSYRLAPPHPVHKYIFSVITENNFDCLNGSGILYNAEVHFAFDVNTDKPTTDDLLNLAQKGRDIINENLRKLMLQQTDLSPVEITPINVEETIPIFSLNIQSAYKEN